MTSGGLSKNLVAIIIMQEEIMQVSVITALREGDVENAYCEAIKFGRICPLYFQMLSDVPLEKHVNGVKMPGRNLG